MLFLYGTNYNCVYTQFCEVCLVSSLPTLVHWLSLNPQGKEVTSVDSLADLICQAISLGMCTVASCQAAFLNEINTHQTQLTKFPSSFSALLSRE